MPSEMTPMMSAMSLVGSLGSVAATAYMWLVRFNKERPNVKVYPLPSACGTELLTHRGDTRFLGCKLGAVVANYSSLPNAVIDVAADLARADGTWHEVEKLKVTTPLPLNIAPMSTALLSLEWVLALPEVAAAEALPAAQIAGGYFAHHFRNPCPVRLSLLALDEREFEAVVPLEG